MNAKTEFMKHVKASDAVLRCALIERKNEDYELAPLAALKIGYGNKELQDFLALLDFEYDEGYGGQELYGTIWYTNGTYSDRGEYDGSEWWEYRSRPPVAKECQP